MPKTKRPLTKSVPSTLQLEELSKEDRKKYDSLLEDFDRQMEQHLTNMDKATETFLQQLESMRRVASLNLSKNARKMEVPDWVPKFDSGAGDESSSCTQAKGGLERALEEVSQQVNEAVSQKVR